MRDTVIFDMDGVLIDSQQMHFNIDMEALRASGASPVLADAERLAGVAIKDRSIDYIQKYRLNQSVDDFIRSHAIILMKVFKESKLVPVRGIPELLNKLSAAGVKTAVASSSSMPLITLILDKLRIRQYFNAVVTSEDARNGKPAPDVFILAAGSVNSPPCNCIVIEDSTSGVIAAKQAGMRCIAYKNPTSGSQDLSGADLIINSFSQLNKSLGWLND